MFKLGFGMMRLPTKEGAIDLEQVKAMTDAFLDGGGTYFDTAYGYMGGKSEETLRKAVVERYPRERFTVATKLPPWEVKAPEDVPRLFETQLARTGAGFFDYYLLHNVNRANEKILMENGAWSFVLQKREEGVIRHLGFSFHDDAAFLDEVLTAHPQVEFVQLQINYADWESADIQARLCYETARRHGKQVVVMEPVRGGALAGLQGEACALMEAANPVASPASWALRYAASLEGLITVLSGMSNMEQMTENIQTFKDFKPLSGAEYVVLDDVMEILRTTPTTPCTACKYCEEGCPQHIVIHDLIATNNDRLVYGHANRGHYRFVTSGGRAASDCIACGYCESRCPQHIGVIELMRECAREFEG